MSGYVSALWPGSPQDKGSPSTSRSGRSSRSSSGSSRGSSRSRSRSRSRRRHQRKYRRYSSSYSRSRSRSRRAGRSPWRGRSRSRSRSRGRWSRRRLQPPVARARRSYGFARAVYPGQRDRRRGRSRSRSRSRTPFRLSEKDRMELLEIAKANAAKALGTTNFDLPASLRTLSATKETSHGTAVSQDGAKSENSVAKPVHNMDKAVAEETSSGSPPKINKKKSPYELWLPV